MSLMPPSVRHACLEELGLQVLQRDWLSANHVVFPRTSEAPATVVDTGYGRHAAMTLALIDDALQGEPLQRIVNTHLHSDHCGGNRALQDRDSAVQAWVPISSLQAARAWDQGQLTHRQTGQHCERFRADGALADGEQICLGNTRWQVHGAPGHDPASIILFEPQTRVMISGDALWEDRLAIIFPELAGADGFGRTHATLSLIERLAPRIVIPGHGDVFEDVGRAIASSRRRLKGFQQAPTRHAHHAARALLMFHMMEFRNRQREELVSWLVHTEIFGAMAAFSGQANRISTWACELIETLIDDGLISLHQGCLSVVEDPGR